MKAIFLFLILSVLLVSCKKETESMSEILCSGAGWKVQTYSVYDDSYDDFFSDCIRHYKDVGTFTFSESFDGKYMYNNDTVPFKWTLVEGAYSPMINIEIDIADVNNFTSPFLYYYFSGQEGTPFMHAEESEIHSYQASLLNNFTIQFVYLSSGSSSSANFGSLEFVVTKN